MNCIIPLFKPGTGPNRRRKIDTWMQMKIQQWKCTKEIFNKFIKIAPSHSFEDTNQDDYVFVYSNTLRFAKSISTVRTRNRSIQFSSCDTFLHTSPACQKSRIAKIDSASVNKKQVIFSIRPQSRTGAHRLQRKSHPLWAAWDWWLDMSAYSFLSFYYLYSSSTYNFYILLVVWDRCGNC